MDNLDKIDHSDISNLPRKRSGTKGPGTRGGTGSHPRYTKHTLLEVKELAKQHNIKVWSNGKRRNKTEIETDLIKAGIIGKKDMRQARVHQYDNIRNPPAPTSNH